MPQPPDAALSAQATPDTHQTHGPDRLLPALLASREVRWSATSGLLIGGGVSGNWSEWALRAATVLVAAASAVSGH